MKQVMKMPWTWTSEDLLFNTGLMLVDFTKGDWVNNVCFHMRDEIIRILAGPRQVNIEPEDWNFSRQCRALGVRAYVTRRVKVKHHGDKEYTNDSPWGDEEDLEYLKLQAKKSSNA
jgi:hypothetical protein